MKQIRIEKQITNRDDASLDKYLREISKYKLLSADEEVIMAERIKLGDQVALDKLVNANLRFVVSVSKQYQNYGISLVDLINEGNLGLVIAAQRFDSTRGFKFISYAVWWIRQSILQSIYEKSKTVRLPANKIGTLSKISQIYNRLEQEFERPPSMDEIANETDLTVEELNNTVRYKSEQVSIDAPLLDDDDIDMLDVLINQDTPDPDLRLMKESLMREIIQTLSSLPDRESEILKLYYGLDGNQAITLEEIAVKLDLTRERIRQIKETAIRKLKSRHDTMSLKQYL